MSETKIKIISVSLSILLTLTLYSFFMDKKEHINYKSTSNVKIDSLTKVIDSLDEVNFGLRVDNMRHELTRDDFFYHHPRLLQQYEEFYSHETE